MFRIDARPNQCDTPERAMAGAVHNDLVESRSKSGSSVGALIAIWRWRNHRPRRLLVLRKLCAARGRCCGRGLDHVDPDPANRMVGQHLGLDGVEHLGMLDQELLGVLASLTDALPAEREPGAALVDD